MNIREKLRAALIKEGAHKANKLGCVMIFLDFDKEKWDELQEMIDEKDLYLPEGETGYGKEVDPHVTVLYGLEVDIPDKDITGEIKKIKTPEITTGDVSSFENEAFDVIKFDMVSEGLHKLNAKFREFPYKSNYPDYHPHCTIAYVNKGTAKKYIDKMNEMDKIEVKPSKIVYSKANGEKLDYKLND